MLFIPRAFLKGKLLIADLISVQVMSLLSSSFYSTDKHLKLSDLRKRRGSCTLISDGYRFS